MTSEDLSLSSLTSLSHTLAGSTPAKDHASHSSSSYSGESGLVAERIRQYTPSVSSEGSRKSAFADFSHSTKVRSRAPHTQSSSSTARTYVLPKEPPVRFGDITGTDVAEPIREPELPEVTPQLPLRFPDEQPKADEVNQPSGGRSASADLRHRRLLLQQRMPETARLQEIRFSCMRPRPIRFPICFHSSSRQQQ